jgi:hypothetical protein
MEQVSQKRRELEDLWSKRTTAAFIRYQEAKQAVRAACEIRADAPAPDSNCALQQALRAENAALDEYIRVLTIFTDLFVLGKIPDETGETSCDSESR